MFKKIIKEIWQKLQFELFFGCWNYVFALCAEQSLHGSLQCVEQSLQICSAHGWQQCRHRSAHGRETCRHIFRDQMIAKTAVFANFHRDSFKTTNILGVYKTYVTTSENKNILRETTFKLFHHRPIFEICSSTRSLHNNRKWVFRQTC